MFSLFFKIESIRCSVSTVALFNAFASRTVTLITFSACLVRGKLLMLAMFLPVLSFTANSISLRNSYKSTLKLFKIRTAVLSPSRINPSNKCSVPIKSLPNRNASSLLNDMISFTCEEKLLSILIVVLYTIIKNIFEQGKTETVKSFRLLYMEVKTDTKEKFHVIRVETSNLSANMAAELNRQLLELLKDNTKNVVVNLNGIITIEEEAAETLVRTQQKFYEAGASFVICELRKGVEAFLDEKKLLELMNVTPTESEAYDIVQMEEIERELLGGDDFDQ